jgi:hypothetical protein
MNLAELYNREIKSLSAADRLRLARLILDDIPPQSMIDFSEEWNDEDLKDFTRAAVDRCHS